MDKKLGFGIFGTAHHHSLSFASAVLRHPASKLVGVYDPDPRLALEFSKRLSVQNFSNLEDFLALKDLDVGIVTSENVRKKDLSIALARSGKHVLCDQAKVRRFGRQQDGYRDGQRSAV